MQVINPVYSWLIEESDHTHNSVNTAFLGKLIVNSSLRASKLIRLATEAQHDFGLILSS